MKNRAIATELADLQEEQALETELVANATEKQFVHDLIAAQQASVRGLVPSKVLPVPVKMCYRRGLIFAIKNKFEVPNEKTDDKGKQKKPKEIRKWTVMRDYLKAKLISDHGLSWDSAEAAGAELTSEIIESLKGLESGVPAASDMLTKMLEREGLKEDIVKYMETNQVTEWFAK